MARGAKKPTDVGKTSGELGFWLPLSEEVERDFPAPKTQFEKSEDGEIELESEVGSEVGFDFSSDPKGFQKLKFKLALVSQRPRDVFIQTLKNERNVGGAFLWAPVLFGLGCLLYFNLPREPLAFAFPVFSVLCLAVAWRLGRGQWSGGLFMVLFLIGAGVSTSQFRVHLVDTTMLSRSYVGHVLGQITQAEYRANGSARYTLDVSMKGGLKISRLSQLPKRIRVSARKGNKLYKVGQFIQGRARLGPPSGPAFPGAYDFSFQSWFRGIGGTGFFLDKPIAVEGGARNINSIEISIAHVRFSIAKIIREALPGLGGNLATALIVGDRSGIDKTTAEALRRSGLAHILAISGLHMALVAVTLIFLLRGIFACFPAIALHYPVRKWASALALLAAAAYLLLSGANVSTQRAYIMVSIMLVATILDRRALTMRNVAVAAFVVLVLTPEAILSPGFQMSFAAVTALVATFELFSKRRQRQGFQIQNGFIAAFKRFAIKDIGGLAMTSLVAGAATGLFAAFHFYRVAPFGLVANLLAMPFVSFAVMPLALLSVLAMPFGLESGPLFLMSFAMDKVVEIATWVATLEPRGNTGFIPIAALGVGSFALLVSTLARTWLKLVSLPLAFLFILLVYNRTAPDILILENGKQIGVLQKGKLRLLRPNAYKFSTKMWRGAFDPESLTVKPKVERGRADKEYVCDKVGCSIKIHGLRVVQINSTTNLSVDCKLADVLIIPFFTSHACAFLPHDKRPVIFDRTELAKYGAHSLSLRHTKAEGGMKINRSYGKHQRPWTRHKF